MQHGRIVETLDTVLLAQNRAEHAYTQLLVDASRDIGAVAPP